MAFIGHTEITVNAVELDLIINGLGCLEFNRCNYKDEEPIMSQHERLDDLRRIHQLRLSMKIIQDRCEHPIF